MFLRREFLRIAGAAAVTLPARAEQPRSTVEERATLDPGRWEEAARQRMEALTRRLGAGSAGYDRDRPPFAVFDRTTLRS